MLLVLWPKAIHAAGSMGEGNTCCWFYGRRQYMLLVLWVKAIHAAGSMAEGNTCCWFYGRRQYMLLPKAIQFQDHNLVHTLTLRLKGPSKLSVPCMNKNHLCNV